MVNRTIKASVRERVRQDKSVRPRDLADAIDVSPSTIYGWIDDGKLEAVSFEGVITIPPHAARPLLGLAEQVGPACNDARAA